MRSELKVFPKLSPQQFLSIGYTANKAALASDIIQQVINLKLLLETELKKKQHSKVSYTRKVGLGTSNVVRNYSDSNSNLVSNYNAFIKTEVA